MSNIDTKSLKKLADICRKAGIKSFKSAEFEFTLTDEKPASNYKKLKEKVSKRSISSSLDVETDPELSAEQLLFYSSMDPLAGIES